MNNLLLFIITVISNGAGKQITDVTSASVFKRLQICSYGADFLRWLFFEVVKGLGVILDYIDTCFKEISKIDFTTIINVGDFEMTLEHLTWGVLTISVLLALILSMFKKEHDLEYIKITLIALFAITCFGQYNKILNDNKNIGMEVIDTTFNKEELNLSERLFYENSYDMLASIKSNELQHINKKIPIDHISINETMSKNDLQGYYTYDETGNITVKDLSDGILNSGAFEQRYYRYGIPISLVFIYAVVAFVMLMGMCKIAYVGFEWFYVALYGSLSMATSVSTMNKIKTAYIESLKSFMAFLFAYAGVYLFQLLVPSIISKDYNILTTIILLFIGGLISILGSGAISRLFGIDDGTSFVLKSFMFMRQMSRLGKSIGKKFRHKGGNSGKGGKNENSGDGGNGGNGNNEEYEPFVDGGGNGGELPNNDNSNRYLPNEDISNNTLYGGDGTTPYFHKPDRDDNIQKSDNAMNADFTETYLSPNEQPEKMNMTSGKGINLLTNADLENYGDVRKVESDYGKHKSYKQYKIDYEQGNTSTLNPFYKQKSNDVVKKSLPKWYENQDITYIPNWEKMSDEELEKEMQNIDKYKAQYGEELDEKELEKSLERLRNGGTKEKAYEKDVTQNSSDEELDEEELMRKLRNLGGFNEKESDLVKKQFDIFEKSLDKENDLEKLAEESLSAYEIFMEELEKGGKKQ